ncbi:MAG: hypothetical protein ACLFWM_11490, partial [Actinomycetota bacterium]
MELQERLRAHMDSEMSATPMSDLGEVMERGERIRRQRKMVNVALPAVAALVVVAGVVISDRVGGGGNRELPEVEGADAVAAANAQLSVQERSLEWEVQPATLGLHQDVTADSGVTYVLSTAPGARFQDFPNGDIPRAIYASSDGMTWDSHPVGGSWVSSIAAADGLLYAVGTGPGAEADSMAVRVATSPDRGETFRETELVEVGSPSSVATRVMAAEGGVLATVSTRTSTDPVSLLPPGTLEGGVEPVMLEEGVAVLPVEDAEAAYEACFGGQPEACDDLVESRATHYSTWEELGLDPEELSFGDVVEHRAFWTEDGEHFEEVSYPFPDGFVDGVFRVGDRTVVSLNRPGGTQLHWSEDARSWEPVADVPRLGWITAMGEVGGQVVIVGQGADGPGSSVFRAPDLSGPWTEIALDELLGAPPGQGASWISAATVGESGVAVSLAVEGTASGGGDNPITALADRLFGDGNQDLERLE